MNRVDVDLYDGDIQTYSDDERVTKALVFYLRAKGIGAIIEACSWLVLMAGMGFSVYIVTQFLERIFAK